MNRRSFLETLGLAAAGVAFNSAIRSAIWELPKDLVLTAGPVTHEWIAAEALKVLCENFDFPSARPKVPYVSSDDIHQLGIDFLCSPKEMGCTRVEYRHRYIEPAMAQLGATMTDRKAKIFLPMNVPAGVEAAHLVTHRESGLNLRYISAADFGSAGVDAYLPPATTICRLDVQFAS